jgi:hypothetical protein
MEEIYEKYGLLGCKVVLFGDRLAFRRNISAPISSNGSEAKN